MANITLILDEAVETREVSRPSPVCRNTAIIEEQTEVLPPLECGAGEKIILFFKDPTVTLDGSGIIVGDILSRNLLNNQYTYYIRYDEALLAPGITPNSLTQCNILKFCCYDCSAEYSDITIPLPAPAILADHMEFTASNAIGGNTNSHTPIDNGAPFSFQEGFDSVRVNAAGGSPGVDVSKMVRAVTLNGTELIVDAAPEHTTLGETNKYQYSPFTNISAVGFYLGIPSPTTTILNPSLVRPFLLTLGISFFIKIRKSNDRLWIRLRISENGGSFANQITLGADRKSPSAAYEFIKTIYKTITIVPGGSYTFSTRTDIETREDNTAVGTEQIELVQHLSNVLGSTV